MVPRCRLLNMGIFRGSSHKINRRWIQVQVNGSTGLGPGPGGAAESGRAGSHSGSTWLLGRLPGSWRRLLFLDVSKGEPCLNKEMPWEEGSRQRWCRQICNSTSRPMSTFWLARLHCQEAVVVVGSGAGSQVSLQSSAPYRNTVLLLT